MTSKRMSVAPGAVATLVLLGAMTADLSAQPAGPVVAWGTGTSGQLMVPQGVNFKAISGDFTNSAGIREDGTIQMWGDFWGGFGTPVPSGRFTAIDGGRDNFVAVREDGALAAWGVNAHGLLQTPSGTFRAASLGSNVGAAVRTDGTLAGWGVLSTTPVPAGNDFVACTAGEGSALALRADGTVAGWGANFWNEFAVPAGTYKDVSITFGWAAGVRSDGSIVFWGTMRPTSIGAMTGEFDQIDQGSQGGSPIGLRTNGTLAMTVMFPGTPPAGTYIGIGAGVSHALAIVPSPGLLSIGIAAIGLCAGRRSRSI